MHFLTLFNVMVLTSVSAYYAIVILVLASADMKIRYISGYRYKADMKNCLAVAH